MEEPPHSLGYVEPEALSHDPNVFERTVILERLREICQKIVHILNAVLAEQHHLENKDCDLMLELMDQLGKIGYISSPGYSTDKIFAYSATDTINQIDRVEAEKRIEADAATRDNAACVLFDLFDSLKFMVLPRDFTNKLYERIGRNIRPNDENIRRLVFILAETKVVPKSIEVIHNMFVQILEQCGTYDYVYCMDELKVAYIHPDAVPLSITQLEGVVRNMEEKYKSSLGASSESSMETSTGSDVDMSSGLNVDAPSSLGISEASNGSNSLAIRKRIDFLRVYIRDLRDESERGGAEDGSMDGDREEAGE